MGVTPKLRHNFRAWYQKPPLLPQSAMAGVAPGFMKECSTAQHFFIQFFEPSVCTQNDATFLSLKELYLQCSQKIVEVIGIQSTKMREAENTRTSSVRHNEVRQNQHYGTPTISLSIMCQWCCLRIFLTLVTRPLHFENNSIGELSSNTHFL